MFDVAFLQQVFLNLSFAGRIEDLLFDLRVYGQLQANLLGELLLAAVAARFLELLEQLLNRAVVLLQESDCVL